LTWICSRQGHEVHSSCFQPLIEHERLAGCAALIRMSQKLVLDLRHVDALLQRSISITHSLFVLPEQPLAIISSVIVVAFKSIIYMNRTRLTGLN